MSINLEEVLSRLEIQGGTTLGGSQFAAFLPILNSSGQLDPSLFTSTTAFYQVTTGGGGLTGISSPTAGAIAILDSTSAYVYLGASWLQISELNSSGINFTPTLASGLTSINVQSAINELAVNAIGINNNATISGTVTFSTGTSGSPTAPFIIGVGSTDVLVPGLNAQLLNGEPSTYYTNASNIDSGTVPVAALAGTYTINISGWAQNAYNANTVAGLDVSKLSNIVSGEFIASDLLSGTYDISISGNAATATTATELNGENAAFYLDPANLTGGFIPSSVFNAASHGSLTGGTLHNTAIATGSIGATAGFISANDQAKVNSVTPGANPNQNAFSFINFGPPSAIATLTGTIVTGVTVINGSAGFGSAPAISFTGGGGTGATATSTVESGRLTAITITSGGSGYTSTPTVVIGDGYGSLASGNPTDTLTLLSASPILSLESDFVTRSITFDIDLSNLQHNSLGGLTVGDPHTQYLNLTGGGRPSQTITQAPIFSTSGAPFSIAGSSIGALVTGLNAQYLSGNASTYYTNAANLSSGYISNQRILPGDTYPISITGTASGGLSLSSGGVVNGPVSVEGLTDTGLAGNGLQIVGVTNAGALTITGLTTALLPEGGGNDYFTFSALYSALQSILQPASGSTLTWNSTSGTTIVPVLSLSTSNVTEGSNLYYTNARVLAEIATTAGAAAILTSLENDALATVAASPNTLALRDSSGDLAATSLNVSTAGSITFGSAAALPGLITTSTTPTSLETTALATVGYVNTLTAGFGTAAVYDLPITNTTGLSNEPTPDINLGELVISAGVVNIIDELPGTSGSYWTEITSSANPLNAFTLSNTLASGGSITSIEFGNLLKASNLVESPAAALIFCPEFRLTEPYSTDALSNSVGLPTTYVNPNFRMCGRNTVQLRGQPDTNYVLMIRLQGLISLRHTWTLVYYTYNSGTSSYVQNTYILNPNGTGALTTWATTSSSQTPTDDEIWAYIDEKLAFYVAGKSELTLEFALRDGKLTPAYTCSFAGIAPFASIIPGTAKPPFNGGFLNITPISVWTNAKNKPFSPYIPDSLVLQSEGDIITGGINYYPATNANDNREYDGEDIIDIQGTAIGLSSTTNSAGFISYATIEGTTTPSDFDKSCVRCSNPAVNKYLGINGFLRKNHSISSGPGLTPPLAANQTALELLSIAQVNTQLAIPLPTTTFTLLGQSVDMTGVTTMGGLITAVNSVSALCDGTPLSNWFTLSYNGTLDRFELQVNCSSDATAKNPPIFDDTGSTAGPLFPALRMVMGPDSGPTGIVFSNRAYGYSLPQASGIAIANDGSTVVSTFFTAFPITIYNGATGSFSIDNNTVSYTLSTTYAQLQASLTALGYNLSYNNISNEFQLDRLPGFFSDTTSLKAPRIYDINGNLMTVLQLVKESHGNADFPIESVHHMVELLSSIGMVGDFKSYSGTTSPGMAIMDLDGQINYQFTPGVGFSSPVYSIAPMSNGSTDIMVGALNSSAFLGYNAKDIYRITVSGNESVISNETATPVLQNPVSQDDQSTILGLVTCSNGDFIVLTPRKITVYTSAGVIRTNTITGPTLNSIYEGTAQFTGMVKWQDIGSLTYFIVSSTTYTSPIADQTYTDLSGNIYVAPAGLRLFRYDQTVGDIYLDPTWILSTGAGVGAAASCAYPIIAGSTSNPYVICGNRAGWWNSGITDETNADWSWNISKKGNLLYESEDLNDTTFWTQSHIASVTTTVVSGSETTNLVSVTDSTQNGNAYIQQIMNLTYESTPSYAASYQPTTSIAVNNPGGITYEFDIELELQNSPTAYAAIQLRFDDNVSNSSWSYAVSAIINLSNTALGTGRLTGYAPLPSLPDNAQLSAVQFQVYDNNVGTGEGTTVIRIVAQDTSNNGPTPGYNDHVTVRVYPAFIPSTSSPGSFSSSPATGSVTILATALRYANVWGAWGTNGVPFADIYVKTNSSSYSLPSIEGDSEDTNSGDFEGLYKISLASATEGQAYSDSGGTFSVSPIIFSEPQSHAIPFGVDSAENIYIGGPIQGFIVGDDNISVIPWRIYKLNKYGAYLTTDPFNLSANFNDRVTSAIVTSGDYLVVAGTFTCYNNLSAPKLIFIDTSGNPIPNIDPDRQDIIIQPTAPTDPELFDKLWLDTSGLTENEPPILMVYDPTEVGGQPLGWTNIVFSNRRLPDPAFIITPDNTFTTDPTGISIAVNSAFTQINLSTNGTGSDPVNGVMLLCNTTINGAQPDFLDSNGNITMVSGNYFTVGETVTIPVNSGSVPETITVYAQIIPSQAMSNAAFAYNASGLLSTSFIFPSEVVSQTFILNPVSATPIISNNSVQITTSSDITAVVSTSTGASLTVSTVSGEVFYYTEVPVGQIPPAFSPANIANDTWLLYTGAIGIGNSCDTYFIGQSSSKASSILVGPITVNFSPTEPSIGTKTVNTTTPTSNTVTVTGTGTGVLFSFGTTGPVPSIANFDNISVFYQPYVGDVATFNILNLLTNATYASLSVYNAATSSITINLNSVTVLGNPSVVTRSVLVDQSYFQSMGMPEGVLNMTLSMAPSVQLTSDSTLTVTNNHTLTEHESGHGSVTGGDPSQLYIAGGATNVTLAYSLVPYVNGVPVTGSLPPGGFYGTFSGTVNYTSGWYIDLQTGLSGSEVNYVIYDYLNFDAIYYTYSSTSGVYPSIDFFETVFNNNTQAYVSGSIATFVWTPAPPTITINSDSTYGIKSFTVANINGGQLYYSLSPTVNLLNSPATNGTVISNGATVLIDSSDGANIQQYIVANSVGTPQLKISLAEVSSTGVALATRYINQTVAATPYQFIQSYDVIGQTPTSLFTLVEITQSGQTPNNVTYGKPGPSTDLMAITDTTSNLSARVIWDDTYATEWTAQVLPVTLGSPPMGATLVSLPYTGSTLTFTPISTIGEIRLGVRLYTPTTLPSRIVNYQVLFNLSPVDFTGLTTVTTAPSPAASGTTLVVGSLTNLPTTAPFTCVVYPDTGTVANSTNRPVSPEVFTVTAINTGTNTLTITRGSPARSILVGDLITIYNLRSYQVVLTTTLETADIRYTLDGSAATAVSDIYLPGTVINVNADVVINAIALPAAASSSTSRWGTSTNQAVGYVTTQDFNNDLQMGLINISFGDCANELSRSDITLQNPSQDGTTIVNCPIGNTILNSTFNPAGYGFNLSGAGNQNCYWNIINTSGFPDFVPLRNARGSHNANNPIQARIYYNTEQFDLSSLQLTSGTGTNSQILLKGINVTGLQDVANTAAGTLVEIENLPSGKYLILAMNMSQFQAGATSVGTNTVATELDIINISESGVVLSNLSAPNPAFYFNGPNPYGDLRFYIDTTREASRRTGIIGQWQAAIIGPNPAIPASSISFDIEGTNIICLQIIPLVEVLQPQVATTGQNQALQKLVYPSLPAGNYDLMYIHGAVKIPELPGFSGEGYFLTYYQSAGVLKTITINSRELFRYNNGAAISNYYSGSVTQFNHAGGDLQLEYYNSSVANGNYGNNLVMNDAVNFSYNTVGSNYPYIAHTLAYTETDPNGWGNGTELFGANDPIIAPVFALINHDLVEDVSSIILSNPSLPTLSDVANTYTALIPAMTSNTAPSGVASATGIISGAAWNAFDRVDTALQIWNNATITYQFPTGQIANGYGFSYGDVVNFSIVGSNNESLFFTLETNNISSILENGGTYPPTVNLFNSGLNTTAYLYYTIQFLGNGSAGTNFSYFQLFSVVNSGNMSPGDMYTYAISYEENSTTTLLSSNATHTVGSNASAILITLPSTPSGVTNIQIWRQETVSGVTRFYLLTTVSSSTTTYTDTLSHAGFQAILTSLPLPPTFNNTAAEDSYLHAPIFIPSHRTLFDLDAFGNEIEIYSYSNGSDVQLLYTTDSSIPVSDGSSTSIYNTPITYASGSTITAASYNTDTLLYSPITTISYPLGESLTNVTNTITIAGFNFRSDISSDSSNQTPSLSTKTYPFVLDEIGASGSPQMSINRYGGVIGSATPNTIGWLSTNNSTQASASDTIVFSTATPAYGSGSTEYTSSQCFYQFSITADLTHNLTISSVGPLQVISQVANIGAPIQTLQSTIYVLNSLFLSSYQSAGWVITDTSRLASSNIVGISFFTTNYQPITAGANSVDFQYSTSSDFSTFTTISTSDINQSGTAIYDSGTSGPGHYSTITGITDISEDINTGLTNNTIIINAGQIGYFRFIPYQSKGSQYYFGFVNNAPSSVEDFTVKALVVNTTNSLTTASLSGSNTPFSISTDFIPNDNTTTANITITPTTYAGATSVGTVPVTISITNTGTPSVYDVLHYSSTTSTSGSITISDATSGGPLVLTVKSAPSVSPHLIRITAAIGSPSVPVTTALDLAVGLIQSNVSLTSNTLTADNVSTTTATVTVVNSNSNPAAGVAVTYAGITSGSLYPGPSGAIITSTTMAIVSGSTLTDVNGHISFTIKGTKAGTAILQFNVPGQSAVTTSTITFNPGPLSVAASIFSCSPATQVPDGVSYITGSVTLYDTFLNPLSAYSVQPDESPSGLTFINTGTGLPLSGYLTTNSSGQTSFGITATAETAYPTTGLWVNTYAPGSGTPVQVFSNNSITFVDTYTVIYSGNGATGGTPPTDSTIYSNGASVTVLGQSTLVNAGYAFVGWLDQVGTPFKPGTVFSITKNEVLSAYWSPGYTVLYFSNGATGGSVPVDSNSPYPANSVVTVLPPGSLIRSGYTFRYWTVDMTGTFYTVVPNESFVITANAIINAFWS